VVAARKENLQVPINHVTVMFATDAGWHPWHRPSNPTSRGTGGPVQNYEVKHIKKWDHFFGADSLFFFHHHLPFLASGGAMRINLDLQGKSNLSFPSTSAGEHRQPPALAGCWDPCPELVPALFPVVVLLPGNTDTLRL